MAKSKSTARGGSVCTYGGKVTESCGKFSCSKANDCKKKEDPGSKCKGK